MNPTFFDGLDELYHHAKFGEDRTTHAGCRCENVVFVYFCHVPRPARCSFESDIIILTGVMSQFMDHF